MVTDSHSVRNRDRVLAGAGLTIAATWAGLEVGDLPAYLFGVPALAAVPTWLGWRSGARHKRALLSATAREQALAESLHTSLEAHESLARDHATLSAELTRRTGSDALTGLANRAVVRERLDLALARSRRSGRPVAALVIDLNGFRQINDAYGHEVGDRVLAEVADRLRAGVRAEDVVGRVGGDEFVVLTEDLHSATDATLIADRIVASLARPITVGRGPLRVRAGIGIAISRAGADEPDDLLKLAGVAMHTAKRHGDGYHLEGAVRVGS